MRFEDYMIGEGYRFVVNQNKAGWVRNGRFVNLSVLQSAWQNWERITKGVKG